MELADVRAYRRRFGTVATLAKGCRKAVQTVADRFVTAPLVDDICFRASRDVLSGYRAEEETLSDVLHTATNYAGFGAYDSISPQQVRSELHRLARRAHDLDPSVVMEIGTAEGGTLYTWSRVLDPDLVISVDLPGGIHGGGYPAEKRKFYREFSDAEYHLLRTDSHESATRAEVESILDGRPIDFLYVDGDHTYSGVKSDFERYSPLVRDGGLVAFHDIVPHPNHPRTEVDRFWREVEDEYSTERLVADPECQEWAGIGVVEWPGEA